MSRSVLPIFALFLIASTEPIQAPAASTALTDVRPSAKVTEYAAEHNIPLNGLVLGEKDAPDRPGDILIALFVLQDAAGTRQWLGEFRSAALTAREAKAKPGTGLGILSAFQSTLHTDTEHQFSFRQTPFALEITTHGPFDETSSAKTPRSTNARVLATRDYLFHGLAPMGEVELRLRAAGKKNPALSFMFSSKYSAEQIAASKARARDAGFTEEDERVYAESIFALVQFAQLAFRTDGVDEIMKEIADSPTLFSGAFTHLDWNSLQLEDGAGWGLPGIRIFRLPYHFFSKTKAKGNFFITAPRPPLQNMAGVIGLTVDETSKAPGKRLIMRVLAGSRAQP